MEYIIVGDNKSGSSCLVYVCGKSLETAEKSLDQMLHNPDKNDKHLMEGLTNFRIDTVEDEDCWWRFGCD